MKVAMATGTVAGQEKPGFTPPSVEELARKFPQLEILELIGRGGMGAVYKARQKELDRIVALKILPPGIGEDAAFAERFAREAKALARLNHPGIITIHDFGRADGLYFFVMEFVDGVNLRQLLASSRVSPREALAIVPQICDALQFAHDQGIVHRDIKPENILLDRRGRVKVADFGLAKLVESKVPLTPSLSPSDGERVAGRPGEGKTPTLTDAGKVMGTPAYMAPEQVEHPGEVDHRADIYALGVVFYQMLTGELPGKRIEPPSKKVQMDVRLDEVVLRALEKNPELRYQQVSDVKTIVETITATPRPSDESAPSSGSPPKVSPCSVSTPEHLHTLPGRLLYNFQAKGELRLDRDALSFDSGWSVVRIPLSSIQALGLGNYPVSVFKRMPTNYLAVTFTDHGVSRTLLLTPTVRATSVRTWVTSRFEPSKTVEICKLAMQWLFALRGAIQASTGRMLPVGHADAKILSRWDRVKARLLAAAVFAIPFAMILVLFEGGLPNPYSELLPAPITNAYAVFHSLPGIVRIAMWIVLYLLAWRLFMALVCRETKKHLKAIFGSISPPAEDTSRLAEVATTRQSWWTWSPLQSPEVGEIYSHLTKAERNHVSVLGLLASAWIVGTCFGIPAFIRSNPGSGKWIVASVWVILFIVSVPMLQRMVRHFLCSTAWAREHGFMPECLRLFSFSRGNLWKACAVLAVGLGLIAVQSRLVTRLSGTAELGASLKQHAAQTKRLSARPVASAKSLQGTWNSPDVDASGTGWPSLVVKGSNLVFHGMDTNYWFKASFSLREDTNPKQLAAVVTECGDPEYVGKTANAIYLIQNDTLTITINDPDEPAVPADFNAPGADKFVLRRVPSAPLVPSLAPVTGKAESTFGPAYGHEQEFRRLLEDSLPMKEYGDTIKDLKFSKDYHQALVVFAHADSKTRREWEFTLNEDAFGRYCGATTQPFYTPGTANTSLVHITVDLLDKPGVREVPAGPAPDREQALRQQLGASVPMKEYGYTIKVLRFSKDYQQALVMFAHSDSKARPAWEFTLKADPFGRYRGMAMQPFYTPGTANTPPIYITADLAGK
jgi:uncharacterized protein (TIGR03067 family)